MSDRLLHCVLPANPYPEGDDGLGAGGLDRYGRELWHFLRRRRLSGSRCRQRLLAGIARQQPVFASLAPDQLQPVTLDIGRDLRRAGLDENSGARAFAFLTRVLELAGEGAMEETDLAAAWVMSCGGAAELPSAASPRRAVVLAACAGALGGRAVHVLGPDEEWARQALAGLAPVCQLLGISLGGLFRDDQPGRRGAIGRCAIVVAAAREMAFEYLRDGLCGGAGDAPLRLRLRRLDRRDPARTASLCGLDMAIVGEADATLLDGASAPIAVTGAGGHADPAEDQEGGASPKGGEVLARLAMQRFFRRYRTLGGCGATVREAAPEMRRVFSLPVVAVSDGAVRRPVVTQVLATEAEKWEAVGDRLAAREAAGEVVLVGVGTPAAAAALGQALEKRSIAWHYLGDPRSLAAPGAATAVQVVVPAAWRSSFLPPSESCRVFLADGQPGGRLDRQLARWAGGGDCEAILSLEDPVVARLFAAVPLSWWRHAGEKGWLRRWAYRAAQWWTARDDARLRQKLLQYDMHMKNMLAFAGKGE